MAACDYGYTTSRDDFASGYSDLDPTTTPLNSSLTVPEDAISMVKGAPEITLLSPQDPEGVIDFFNAPGKDHYLFVRMLSDPIFEAKILLGKAQGTPDRPINYWTSASAIKKGVPFSTFCWNAVALLFDPYISIAKNTEDKIVWGKRDLVSTMYKGLDENGKIDTTVGLTPIERNPDFGGKLQEIQDRIYGRWPDLTTKELYAFLYSLYEIMKLPEEQRDKAIRTLFAKIKGFDLNKLPKSPIKDTETAIRALAPNITDDVLSKLKNLTSLMSEEGIEEAIKAFYPDITDDVDKVKELREKIIEGTLFEKTDPEKKPTRYSSLQDPLHPNEVLIHPIINKVLGIVCVGNALSKAKIFQKYFKDNGGPHFPIFMYTPGNLTLKKSEE